MSNKRQKLFNVIVTLNLIFIVSYGVNIIREKSVRNKSLTAREAALAVMPKIPFREIEYGDTFPNHNLKTIDNREIPISDTNKQFKFITIVYSPIVSEFKVNTQYFEQLSDFQKGITGKDIIYISLFINAQVNELDIPLLKKIQEKYNIQISIVTDTAVISKYKLKSLSICGGITILLDRKNIVRFIESSVSNDILILIINNEMLKSKYMGKINEK